mgnify:CR=1 FL=1
MYPLLNMLISQRNRFDERGLRFSQLEQTHETVMASTSTGFDRVIETTWCCKTYLKEIPMLVKQEKPDRIIEYESCQ